MPPQGTARIRVARRPVGAVSLVLAAALLPGALVAGGASAQSGVSTTTVTAPSGASSTALLTSVTATNTGPTTAVVRFTFAEPGPPGVTVRRVTPPVLASPIGEPVAVGGDAFATVAMFPASGVDLGTCTPPAPPVPGPGESLVRVAFTCATPASGPWPATSVDRAVPTPADDTARLEAALGQLLGGPLPAEIAAGFSSQFSAATAGAVTVTIEPSGRVVVDLPAGIAAALPAPDGAQLARELDGTVRQLPGATGARYTIAGDCGAFATWTGLASCDRTQLDLDEAFYAPTYTGPGRIAATGAGPLVEVVGIEDFEAVLGWAAGLRVPAGSDVVATVAAPAGGMSVEVTFTVVALPTPAPVSPTFTG